MAFTGSQKIFLVNNMSNMDLSSFYEMRAVHLRNTRAQQLLVLSRHQRCIIDLHLLHGYSFREIAKMMTDPTTGKTPHATALCKSFHRGMRRLISGGADPSRAINDAEIRARFQMALAPSN